VRGLVIGVRRDALPWSFSCQVLDVELELGKAMFRNLQRSNFDIGIRCT
jgi:hypothetical protein